MALKKVLANYRGDDSKELTLIDARQMAEDIRDYTE